MAIDWLFGLTLATLRTMTPLLFAALGGLMSERAGVINIALEGKLLIAAFAAAAVAHFSQSAWMGAMGGMAAGLGTSLFYGFFVLYLRANQIVAGTALNLIAIGLPPLLCKAIFGQSGSTPPLPEAARFLWEPLLASWLLAFGVFAWTRWAVSGTWHYLAGEHPAALTATGIPAHRIRWIALAACGLFAGAGGTSLSLYLASGFSRNMSAGRGFIALAALILGKWRPLPTLLACLLFGLAEAFEIRLQGLPSIAAVLPSHWLQALPYLLTLVVLTGFMGKSRPPTKLGQVEP